MHSFRKAGAKECRQRLGSFFFLFPNGGTVVPNPPPLCYGKGGYLGRQGMTCDLSSVLDRPRASLPICDLWSTFRPLNLKLMVIACPLDYSRFKSRLNWQQYHRAHVARGQKGGGGVLEPLEWLPLALFFWFLVFDVLCEKGASCFWV